MKRTILKKLTACLCLCAVLSGALTVPAGAASFQDVPSNHWAATAIDRCAAGMVSGQDRRYLRRGPAHDPGGLRRGTQPFFRLAER